MFLDTPGRSPLYSPLCCTQSFPYSIRKPLLDPTVCNIDFMISIKYSMHTHMELFKKMEKKLFSFHLNLWWIFFFNPESVQGQVRWGLEQPDLVENDLTHGRELEQNYL